MFDNIYEFIREYIVTDELMDFVFSGLRLLGHLLAIAICLSVMFFGTKFVLETRAIGLVSWSNEYDPPEQKYYVGTTTTSDGSNVMLRSRPTTVGNDPIGRIPSGEIVLVCGRTDNGWYLISFARQRGYVSARLVVNVEEVSRRPNGSSC